VKRTAHAAPAATAAGPSPSPFPYGDYVEARTTLLRAVRGRPFYALLAGASGMGKTCLLRDLANSLDRHRHHVVYVSSSRASLVGVVRFLAQSLHVSPRRTYLETVQVLAEAIQAQTAHLLLWVDEAHEVDTTTLQGDMWVLASGIDHPEGIAWSPEGIAVCGTEAGDVLALDASTGAVSWTPTQDHAGRQVSVSITVTVSASRLVS